MERPMTVSNILYTLVVGLVDFEALGYSLPSIWVNPALYINTNMYIWNNCCYSAFKYMLVS